MLKLLFAKDMLCDELVIQSVCPLCSWLAEGFHSAAFSRLYSVTGKEAKSRAVGRPAR